MSSPPVPCQEPSRPRAPGTRSRPAMYQDRSQSDSQPGLSTASLPLDLPYTVSPCLDSLSDIDDLRGTHPDDLEDLPFSSSGLDLRLNNYNVKRLLAHNDLLHAVALDHLKHARPGHAARTLRVVYANLRILADWAAQGGLVNAEESHFARDAQLPSNSEESHTQVLAESPRPAESPD
ncbi:hypothetical protein H696_03684 [Fonticula alba]|uniref:Uncharacterized protein n=1 Tax=Fonticula alba TaxID=691883 RepID=A0A058Z546_FONAL|nr:hypothetical protein H696_03684 [Fonticula alba]KCV69256.1 hypothetical protein H696_03684 [Fonticula alba]|eukprot:XP_009495821.1 hypothetical protein H696_03684 [Fonticula alba]